MFKQRLQRWLLLACGFLSLGLGAAGVFVPLLPTTPFLLLASACFLRSSNRLHRWLLHHRWFGSYIRNYRDYKATTHRAKVIALILLWGSIGYAALFVAQSLWLRLLLLVIAVGVTIHLVRLQTLTPEMVTRPVTPEHPTDSGTGGAVADSDPSELAERSSRVTGDPPQSTR